MAHQFTVNPFGTIGEFWSYSKVLSAGSSAVKRSPVGRLALEEIYIRAQPVQLRPSVRAIIKSAEAQRSLYPTSVKNLKKPNSINFLEIKTLTKTEGIAVRKALEKTDSFIFGSVAGRTAAGKRFKSKLPQPHDVDLATSSIKKFNVEFLKALPKAIKKNYKVKGERIIRKSNGETLLDVKPISRLLPNRSIITRRGYLPVSGYVNVIKAPKGSILPRLAKKKVTGALEIPTGKLIKVDGIKITGFGEQTLRKGLGTLQVLIEKNVRRAKDPQAFVNSLQIQLEALKLTKPKTIIGKFNKKRRIKTLKNALKILTSKSFQRLLEKKSPGITKEFPILRKISVAKLKKAKKLSKEQLSKKKPIKRKRVIKRKFVKKKITRKKPIKRKPTKKRKVIKKKIVKRKRIKKRKPSKLPRRRPSRIPKGRVSKIPKARPSRLPSRLTKSKIARAISKLPPKARSKLVSKLPDKIKSKLPSKIPPSSLSKLISKLPNKTVSKLISKLPSKLKSTLISKLPGRIRKTKIGKPKPVKVIKPRLKRKKVKRKKKGPGYSVLIRERGKTVRGNVPRRLLPRKVALRVRDTLIDNTVAASGKIVRGKRKVPLSRKSLLLKKPKRKIRKLRRGKTRKTRDKVVEKRKNRIDTRGEKKGLRAAKLIKNRLRIYKKKKKRKKKVKRSKH